jgi:large subunit ribosomal protein L22
VPGPKTNERPGTRAMVRGAPMSAYKIREVLDLVRNQPVERAAEILEFCERGAAEIVAKVLKSAVANAAENDGLPDADELYVSACFADEAKTQRRMRPRARGRASRIRKRFAHVTVIVSRMPEDQLARVRAKRELEQAARRARRAGSQGRPSRRRRGAAADDAPARATTAAAEQSAAPATAESDVPPVEDAPAEADSAAEVETLEASTVAGVESPAEPEPESAEQSDGPQEEGQ